MSSSDLSGVHVVVTGASSGIGRATAIRFADCGASRVLIHFHKNELGAEQTAREVESRGCKASIAQADIGDPDQVEALVDSAFGQLGVIHSWVNNAGADVLTGAAAEIGFDEKLRLLMDVDVLGTIRLARIAGPRLGNQPLDLPPAMTFIGWDQSLGGMEGDPGQMFGPVKSAVTAFANSLAQTLAPRVRVNTVAPGWIQTKWGNSADDYWDQRAKTQSLMGRWGTPEDVARAIAFASDPNNSFVTGQTIQVNGGWSRRHSV